MNNDNKQFSALAEYYDRLNGADYPAYCDYIKKVFAKHGSGKEELILDLGCGTGKLTSEMAKQGFDMIGVDISPDMLSEASMRAYEAEQSILYLLQDMRSFELYGTVDAVICALDGVSYLYSREDVLKCFKLVRNYLNPGALFLFDVNSVYRFYEVLSKRDYFLEDDGVYLGWRSEIDEESSECDFILTLFAENEDGTYTKREEIQTEKIRKREELELLIEEAGLEMVGVYSGFDMQPAEKTSEKWFFVAKCPNNK